MRRSFKIVVFLLVLMMFSFVVHRVSLSFSDVDTDDGDDIYDIQVLAPNGGEKLIAGQKFEISWFAGSAIEYVKIEYSADEGKTWRIIANDVKMQDTYANYVWKVPCTISDKCELKISDAYGMRYDYSFGTFSIIDNQPPKLSVSVEKESLWPPDHRMVNVGLKYSVVDNCDPGPKVVIKVTSDEPTASDTSSGGAKYSPDAIIKKDGTILLRAERAGDGDGRVYQITVIAQDDSGNGASTKVLVRVNKKEGRIAINSGQFYDATAKD